MGLIYAEIELINYWEMESARRHIIGEEEIKRITVNALVDTGAYMLCINESIKEILGLEVIEKRKGILANGSTEDYDVVAGVELRFKNRRTLCNALVLPGDSEVLFGAIPMEDMDVLISPLRQELIVNPDHPYFAHMSLK